MSLYVGIDAGGTRTSCWVGDGDRVLAKGSGATVKLMNVSESEATARLQGLIRDALAEAGVRGEDVTRTVVGLAGLSSKRVRAWAETTLNAVLAGEILLLGDEEIALDAAFGDGPGILVIAGTGSNVVGRDREGQRTSVGGWGPVLGDEGSGYWIGLEALRAALRARDRVQPSLLLDRIQEYWKLASLGDLVGHGNASGRVPFGELTHVVVACAGEGDVLAAEVLARAGDALAEAVVVVASRLRASIGPAIPVAYAGSVLDHIDAVRKRFIERLAADAPDAIVQTPAVEPLAGALWRARRG